MTHFGNDNNHQIQFALVLTTVLNFCLAFFKIGVGHYANSLALFGDGIDSASDVISGVLAFIAARIIARPPDHNYPFGYNRAETLATYLAAIMIAMAGLQLLLQSIQSLLVIHPEESIDPFALYAVLASVLVKSFLVFYLAFLFRKTDSNLIYITGLNMRYDVLLSLGVLAGIGGGLYFQLIYLDAAIAFLLGLWIQYNAYQIVRETLVELMDGLKDPGMYTQVKQAALNVDALSNPHRMRIRRLASKLMISLDIEVNPELNVREGHKLAQAVEDQIKLDINDVYDVLVHVEPRGNIEDESYGVASDTIE